MCYSGFLIARTNATTCLENGEWELETSQAQTEGELLEYINWGEPERTPHYKSVLRENRSLVPSPLSTDNCLYKRGHPNPPLRLLFNKAYNNNNYYYERRLAPSMIYIALVILTFPLIIVRYTSFNIQESLIQIMFQH